MLWLLAVFIAYWAIIEIMRIKGKLEKYGKNYGPILLLRTAKGLSFVERISKPRLFWKAFATLGIPLMLFGMAVMMALLILADIVMLISPPKPSELTSPQAALLIPGINPFIPLVWGIIGLAVAIVVHELSHAVLCRVEGIKVKSLGIILALFPIGAFAEPEEKELLDRNRSKSSKIRVYTAGISANYIVAFIAFALFFSMLPSLNPVVAVVDERGEILGKVVEVNGKPVSGNFDSLVKEGEWNYMLIENDTGRHEIKFYGVFGVKVIGLYREGGTFPAEIAGIKGGTMITKLDGRKVRNIEEFREVMMQKRPGEDVEVETYDPGSGNFDEFRIKLVERDGKAFMGVYLSNYECVGGFNVVNTGILISSLLEIPSRLGEPSSWLILISMPFSFQGFSGMERLFENPAHTFWILNSLYWIAWINFYVALFNCLPAIPLDGGRMFQEMISALLRRSERGEEISAKMVRALSFFVFLSISLMILIPNLRL